MTTLVIVLSKIASRSSVYLHIFNLSSLSGIFPNSLKIGKVAQIYKAGDSSNLGNYRPISVLPCFSKILERIVYNRVYTYLQENKILYYKQGTLPITLSFSC